MQVTIYHNPRCSKSRETLQLLVDRGVTPQVINYLETPPDADTLQHLGSLLGLGAHQMIRTNEAAYSELHLGGSDKTDAELFQAMAEHPILLQRPIVVANGKARIGRPPEAVLEVLE